MAEISIQSNKLVALLSEEELLALGFSGQKEFEIIKAKEGLYVLIEKQGEKKTIAAPDGLEQKITGYLNQLHPKDRVVGKFETSLSKEELDKFREMVAQNKVEQFKTNPKYIKYIYRQKAVPAPVRVFESREKKPEEYSLEKDGFIVTRNEQEAQKIGSQISDKIKSGQIRGTRSFTGYFYIIDSKLLEQTMSKIIELIKKQKSMQIDEISAKLSTSQTLIRIACTFLGEEGIILEKRKDYFQLIE